MKKVDVLLSDYAFYHQTIGNKICHFVGIPLIMFALMGLLRPVVLMESFTAAELLIALSFIYYLLLDVRLAIGMLLVATALDFLAWRVADIRVAIVAMIVGWIFQGIGHAVYEKRSPAFTRNLVHLLVGPLFLLNEALPLHKITEAPKKG